MSSKKTKKVALYFYHIYPIILIPVSYTHLDVYKRQILTYLLWGSIILLQGDALTFWQQYTAAISPSYTDDGNYQNYVRRVYSFATYKGADWQDPYLADYLQDNTNEVYVAIYHKTNGDFYCTNPDLLQQDSENQNTEDPIIINQEMIPSSAFTDSDAAQAMLPPAGFQEYYYWDGQTLQAEPDYQQRYYEFFENTGDGLSDEQLQDYEILVAIQKDLQIEELAPNSELRQTLEDIARTRQSVIGMTLSLIHI